MPMGRIPLSLCLSGYQSHESSILASIRGIVYRFIAFCPPTQPQQLANQGRDRNAYYRLSLLRDSCPTHKILDYMALLCEIHRGVLIDH